MRSLRSLIALLLILGISIPQLAFAAPATLNLWDGSDRGAGQEYKNVDLAAISEGLREGSRGDGVEALQQHLVQLGYLDSHPAAFGDFDAATRQAVLQYQQFYGLATTGVIDQDTLAQLWSVRYDPLPDVLAGNAGAPEGYVLTGGEWDDPDLTYAFDNPTSDLSSSAQEDAVRQALATWAAVTPLTFTEVGLNQRPEIVVSFEVGNHGDGAPFDNGGSPTNGNVLAHAFFPPYGTDPWWGRTLHGDAHFDDYESWSVDIPVPGGHFDLTTVAIHEFGHSLGLNHSNVPGSTMFPTYAGADHTLSADDIAGIQAIYGSGSGGEETIDAAVESVSVSPSSVALNQQVTGTVQVRNEGDQPAAIPVTVAGPGGFSYSKTTSTVQPGQGTSFNFTWTASIGGNHSFTATANLAGDENGGNDSATSNTVTVFAEPAGDLYVAGIEMSWEPFWWWHRVTATISVGATSGDATGATVAGRWIYPNGSMAPVSGTVNSNGTLTLTLTTGQTGIHQFEVLSISKGGYSYNPSLNSGNPGQTNVGDEPEPPSVDAELVSLSASPSSLEQNSGNVTFTATVRNNGTGSASIQVALNSGSAGFSDTETVNLGAGASTQVEFVWPAGVIGSHTFTASVSLAGDSDSGNNSKSTSVTVNEPASGGGEDIYVENISVWRLGNLAITFVQIGTDDGASLAGAEVTATVTNGSGSVQTYQGNTTSAGRVTLWISLSGGGPHTIEVVDIELQGYQYNPGRDQNNPEILP